MGGDVGIPVGATGAQVGAHAVHTWEKKQSYKQLHESTLRGSIVLDNGVREVGPNNAVLLTLSEDDAAASSVVTDFRASVLLERKNNTDIFTAKVKKGRAFFLYNVFRGIRDITPFRPTNDPVRFQPGTPYLRQATQAPAYEARLSTHIEETELTAGKLAEVAGVLSSTVLTTQV